MISIICSAQQVTSINYSGTGTGSECAITKWVRQLCPPGISFYGNGKVHELKIDLSKILQI